MADKRIFLTTTGAGTWTVPADWNSANNSIECIGGGGGSSSDNSRTGGGGGAYSKKNNISLSSGQEISFNIGIGGYSTTNGGDTWFNSTTTVLAKGGVSAGNYVFNNGRWAYGGDSSLGYGDVKYSGGYSYYLNNKSGGGGAAGVNGNGNNSHDPLNNSGASGDAGYGGAGGSYTQNGGNGTEWDSTHGSGGGGGGYGGGAGLYGAGAGYYGNVVKNGSQGLIVITYTPAVASNFFKLLL